MTSRIDLRPRRSVLYLPSSNTRALHKAQQLAADTLIFDLEDAVAPQAKSTAREQACGAVSSGLYGHRELVIRCNGLGTPWGPADVAAIATSGAAAVVVPKVRDVDDLQAVDAALRRAGAPENLAVWAMIETPAALFSLRGIAAFPRVAALVLGTNDLAYELHATVTPDRASLLPHLAVTLAAARAAGVAALDGVFNNIRDLTGFEAECRQGAALGFDGKSLIHPDQVPIANRVWSPTADEISRAARVIEAYETAVRNGRGVAVLDGTLVESLHVETARRTLAVAEANSYVASTS